MALFSWKLWSLNLKKLVFFSLRDTETPIRKKGKARALKLASSSISTNSEESSSSHKLILASSYTKASQIETWNCARGGNTLKYLSGSFFSSAPPNHRANNIPNFSKLPFFNLLFQTSESFTEQSDNNPSWCLIGEIILKSSLTWFNTRI